MQLVLPKFPLSGRLAGWLAGRLAGDSPAAQYGDSTLTGPLTAPSYLSVPQGTIVPTLPQPHSTSHWLR